MPHQTALKKRCSRYADDCERLVSLCPLGAQNQSAVVGLQQLSPECSVMVDCTPAPLAPADSAVCTDVVDSQLAPAMSVGGKDALDLPDPSDVFSALSSEFDTDALLCDDFRSYAPDVTSIPDTNSILGDLRHITRTSTADTTQCMLIYDVVKASGKHNFEQCRIPLPTNFNIPLWRKYLCDYDDKVICDFLEFGWPTGYSFDHPPAIFRQNHTSATAYPSHVAHYLNTELEHGAILGPYAEPPFNYMVTIPLMSRPKKNSDSRRIIMDFSFPEGQSVNSGIPKYSYLGNPYKLQYPTVDDYARMILSKGRGCLLYKVDVARAFRILPADPLDYPLLGIWWDGQYYLDTAIGFGLRTGSMICQRVTNAVGYIMKKVYAADTLQYVDDCVGAEISSTGCCDTDVNMPAGSAGDDQLVALSGQSRNNPADQAFHNLRHLLAELGIPESVPKLCFPDTCMEFIGVV